MKESTSFNFPLFLLFLLLNFGALALGGLFTGSGVTSDWYENLNQAPWTPPGWVFGAAWTTIMLCFSFYMSVAWQSLKNKRSLLVMYTFQWVFNVGWNPLFFYFHQTWLAFVLIISLTIIIGVFLFYFSKEKTLLRILVLPYFCWLVIASSLNGYICFFN